MRRFNDAQFAKYGNWFEYSIYEDLHFAYVVIVSKMKNGLRDAFTTKGFRGQNNINRFKKHVGEVTTVHNQCVKQCENFMMQRPSI